MQQPPINPEWHDHCSFPVMMVDEPHTTGHEEKPRLNPSARHWALPFVLLTLLAALLALETGQWLAWLFTTLSALAALNIWLGGGRRALSLSEFFHTRHDTKRKLTPVLISALLTTGLLLILYGVLRTQG